MRGQGISFHGPVNLCEAGGHRSKPEVVLASHSYKKNKLELKTSSTSGNDRLASYETCR